MWEKDVCSLHSLAIRVLLHIERLDFAWIVGHDDRTFEVFLNEITLMLTTEIHSPTSDWELELHTISNCLLENLYTFCVS